MLQQDAIRPREGCNRRHADDEPIPLREAVRFPQKGSRVPKSSARTEERNAREARQGHQQDSC